jgi:hypothetical protein
MTSAAKANLAGPVDEAKAYLDKVSQQWDDVLSRLRSFVEQ